MYIQLFYIVSDILLLDGNFILCCVACLALFYYQRKGMPSSIKKIILNKCFYNQSLRCPVILMVIIIFCEIPVSCEVCEMEFFLNVERALNLYNLKKQHLTFKRINSPHQHI